MFIELAGLQYHEQAALWILNTVLSTRALDSTLAPDRPGVYLKSAFNPENTVSRFSTKLSLSVCGQESLNWGDHQLDSYPKIQFLFSLSNVGSTEILSFDWLGSDTWQRYSYCWCGSVLQDPECNSVCNERLRRNGIHQTTGPDYLAKHDRYKEPEWDPDGQGTY